MAEVSYVAYHVPGDGDAEDVPNMFVVRKPMAAITLADIKQLFPLPGSYFFRAKQAYRKTFVWLDLSDDAKPVPLFGSSIVLKVSRFSFDASQQLRPAPAAALPRHPVSSTPTSASVAREAARAPTHPSSSRAPAAPAAADTDNLLDFGSELPSTAPVAAPAPAGFDPFSQQAPLGAFSFDGSGSGTRAGVSSGLTPTVVPTQAPGGPAVARGTPGSFGGTPSMAGQLSPVWSSASPRGAIPMAYGAPGPMQGGVPRPMAGAGPARPPVMGGGGKAF